MTRFLPVGACVLSLGFTSEAFDASVLPDYVRLSQPTSDIDVTSVTSSIRTYASVLESCDRDMPDSIADTIAEVGCLNATVSGSIHPGLRQWRPARRPFRAGPTGAIGDRVLALISQPSPTMSFLLDRQNDIERELARVLDDLPAACSTSSRHVRDLVRYVHSHLFEPGLNVAVARSECGLRDNNVSSLFRHEVGCSIKDYIDRLRMEAARRLLQHRRFSVFEICQSLGYTHPQTFYRVYRRHFGRAPASERRPALPTTVRTFLVESHERTA